MGRNTSLPPEVVRVLDGWAHWSKSRKRVPDPDGVLLRDFLVKMFDKFLDLASKPTGSLKPDLAYRYVAFILASEMEWSLGTDETRRIFAELGKPRRKDDDKRRRQIALTIATYKVSAERIAKWLVENPKTAKGYGLSSKDPEHVARQLKRLRKNHAGIVGKKVQDHLFSRIRGDIYFF